MSKDGKSKVVWRCSCTALHTAASPAGRTAAKTGLSYRNDTIITFFFTANKNKDNAKVLSVSASWQAGHRRSIFGAKLEALRRKMSYISFSLFTT